MWKEAINSEIESILHNLGNLWIFHQVVNLSSKWVFKGKRKVDGSIDKYKERFVIKGYK